jgi:hypothetical protein
MEKSVGMKRFLAASAFALSLGAALGVASALAKDVALTVTLDGRPLDARVPTGLLHRGSSFIDVVRATKTFSGLLIFGKNDRSVNVTIREHGAHFVVGSRDGSIDGEPTTFGAAPFRLYGDVYVPLAPFAKIAGVTLKVDAKRRVAILTTPSQ